MNYNIEIDSELEDLIPTYIKNLYSKIQDIQQALTESDFEKCRVLGHNMKGSGGGYGLNFVSECGLTIEDASTKNDPDMISKKLVELKDFLDNVKIKYI